jgi:uncharacterized membrane protein YebE (DUF533 family)
MLEQLLKSGLSMLDSKTGDSAVVGVNQPDSGLGKFGTGAVAGGALGLLLGSKGGRRIGGKALQYGGVAALGVMAFRAFSNWQAQQAQAIGPTASVSPSPSMRTVNLLPSPEIEAHSRGMLKAMIAAAKADGHMDERERGLVEAELSRLEADPVMRQWFDDELRRPLDPAEVAQAAASPELAAEMYLVSLLMVDDTSFMERAYLDELARQLKLSESLQIELERQARGD